MGIWAWIQPVDRIWKVITDPDKGTLCVFNEKSELINEHKGMSRQELTFIEENFLHIVATELCGNKESYPQIIEVKTPIIEHNYMYA